MKRLQYSYLPSVAPFVGAWIEMYHPFSKVRAGTVAPFVGAWIEIHFTCIISVRFKVAPFVGAWIEIQKVR